MDKMSCDRQLTFRKASMHQYYPVIIALAFCSTLGYVFFWDDAASSPRGRVERLHNRLDDAFLEAQRASGKSPAPRRLDEHPAIPSANGSVVVDPAAPPFGNSFADADTTCRDLGVTPEMVLKSRIMGNTERWHRVIRKVNEEGYQAKVAVLGGSVTAGSECEHKRSLPFSGCEWPSQLDAMMKDLAHPNVRVDNLAVPATPSSAGITTVIDLVDYDVIVISFTTNDDSVQTFFQGDREGIQPPFETLIRTGLALPKNPAVIIFEDLGGYTEPISEVVHYALAVTYEIPVISARAAFWRQVGFDKERDWSNYRASSKHPKAVWAKRLACLMYGNWVYEERSKLDMSGWTDPLEQPPLYGGTTMRGCKKLYAKSALDDTLEHSAIISDGWSYYADTPGKFGYITNTTGSVLEFTISHHSVVKNPVLFVHYVRGWSHDWGTAEVRVRKGTDAVTLLECHVPDGGTQAYHVQIPLELEIKSRGRYVASIKNLGGKIKITRVLLYSCSDEATVSA